MDDLLERLAKELSNTEPKKPIKFGTQEKPDPRFQPGAPPPLEPGTFVPRWRKN
jgi:hypothetical protein